MGVSNSTSLKENIEEGLDVGVPWKVPPCHVCVFCYSEIIRRPFSAIEILSIEDDWYENNKLETEDETSSEKEPLKKGDKFGKTCCGRRRFIHDFLKKGLKLLRHTEKATTRWIHESSCLESVRKDSGASCLPMTANFFTQIQMYLRNVTHMCQTMETGPLPTRNIGSSRLEQKSDDTMKKNDIKDILGKDDIQERNNVKDILEKDDTLKPRLSGDDFKDLQERKLRVTDADLCRKNDKAYVSEVNDALENENCQEEMYVENDDKNDDENREGEEGSSGDMVHTGDEVDLHLYSSLESNEENHHDCESAPPDCSKDNGNYGEEELTEPADKQAATFYELRVGNKPYVGLPYPVGTKKVIYKDNPPTKEFTLKVIPNPPTNFERDSKVKRVHCISSLECLERKFVKEEQQCHKKFDLTLLECDIGMLRDVAWLPMHELPVPKVEIPVYYVDQFPPLIEIITKIAEGNTPRPQESMRYELLRLCTLRTYPRENKPYLIRLAAAGFYYASDGDGVVCYCCGIRRYGWNDKDDPMSIHKRINQHCKFFKKNAEYNVPAIAFGPLREKVALLDAIPDCEVPNYSEDVNNDNEGNRQNGQNAQSSAPNRTGLGIQTSMPKHPQYAPKTTRENSYNGWPNTSSHTPIELADAGFYFAGFGDCVRCFHCGIGLRHWDKEDNVWIEHARWAKDCVFLLQKKGREFVELVQLAVQYTNELEDQTGATGSSNVVPDLEKYLVGDASQYVLTKGFAPIQIKEALEAVLSKDPHARITGPSLLQKVIELHGKKNEPSAANNTSDITAEITVSIPEATENQARGENNEAAAVADPKAIKEENEQLKEQTVCKVCLDNTVSIVFLPCGHLVTCADCAPAMRKCPICRAVVKGTVRTYMS